MSRLSIHYNSRHLDRSGGAQAREDAFASSRLRFRYIYQVLKAQHYGCLASSCLRFRYICQVLKARSASDAGGLGETAPSHQLAQLR